MTRVKDEMVADGVAATVPGTRRDLLALFLKHGHAGFPVVKAGARKLVGLVTRQHLLEQSDESQIALLMDPNPPATYPQAPLREAARLLVHRGLRLLPAVNGVNDLVGVVTARELLAALPAPTGHLAPHLRRRVAPVHHATPIPVALEILRAARVSALPILDDEGRYSGLVTDGDLLRSVRITDATVRTTAGQAADGDAWRWEGLRDERNVRHATTALTWPPGTIGSLARTGASTVGPNTPIRDAIALLLEGGDRRLPVLDEGGHLVDLLGDVELLRMILPPA